ncbi:nitrogen fixation protein NifQ [Niveibacterium sp. 24ML]|uniref:nitrogen fixation protein NifQ n=1 Tax=Niveibacterium sp. 24ML TaxID=2985512 RepID=UPI00226D6DBB|nr:nitrogen fixation protein NifQ [Niveibacterium sp. 24ML]MCX9154684.1 nitrogen fixation protein NifQ [Niveibacterium sp. 24ML]
MNAPEPSLSCLAEGEPSLEHLVLACGIAKSQRLGAQPLIRGLSDKAFARLCEHCMPGAPLHNGRSADSPFDEFDELFDLLCEHAAPRDELSTWLAATIATAAQRDEHLWQDMGLPSRRELSAILHLRFPTLAALNDRDMKWKKFFYRQLCQRAEVPICKSPNCADCSDLPLCFGPEV